MKEVTCKKKLKHEWQAIRKNKDISHTLHYSLVWDIIVFAVCHCIAENCLVWRFYANSKSTLLAAKIKHKRNLKGFIDAW